MLTVFTNASIVKFHFKDNSKDGSSMSSYRCGYLVELKARDELKKLGAKIVVRSSGSRTPVDLIAIFPHKNEIWLVQVKAKREAPKNISKLKRELPDLINLSGTYTVQPKVYMKRKRKYGFIEVS